jgi:hypothetical protein
LRALTGQGSCGGPRLKPGRLPRRIMTAPARERGAAPLPTELGGSA